MDGDNLGDGLGLEFVLLNLHGRAAVVEADDAASCYEAERTAVIELCGPTDGNLNPASRDQQLVCGEKNPGAAHVDGLADPGFFTVLLA